MATKERATRVQFGAGNIGRSFIGQLFSRAGYEVVFVDVDRALVDRMNRQGGYRVVVKRGDGPDETISVDKCRALPAEDSAAVAEEIAGAAYIATSVGKAALPAIFPHLAQGLKRREIVRPGAPVDIIIAENIRNGASYFERELAARLSPDYPLADRVGLVETSIGKMVPLMPAKNTHGDPLLVFAEPYNELIVDGFGFRTTPPALPNLKPVANIVAYVDRKLFIHNLGHAAVAYLGYRRNPEWTCLWEALESPEVRGNARAAMEESARALHAAYPKDLPLDELDDHIEDLLARFRNRALGDTLFRVGRDIPRKLHKSDRIVGAALLADSHGLPLEAIIDIACAAMEFRATGPDGRMFPADQEFAGSVYPRGIGAILEEICELSWTDAREAAVMRQILRRCRR